MTQIFDFVNVNYVHNETFAYRLPPSYLEQAQALADFHEHGVFTDQQPNGIGNGVFFACSIDAAFAWY